MAIWEDRPRDDVSTSTRIGDNESIMNLMREQIDDYNKGYWDMQKVSKVDEIIVTELARINTEGGDVLKVLDTHLHLAVLEAYFSLINFQKKNEETHTNDYEFTVPIGLLNLLSKMNTERQNNDGETDT